MSKSPIGVAVEFQEAFGNRDLAAIVPLFSTDGSIHVAGDPSIATIGVHRGHKEIEAFFSELISTVTPVEMELKDLLLSETDVVALGHFHYKLINSDREYESDFSLNLSVKDGKIQRYQMYEDSFAVSQAFASEAGRAVRGPDGNRIDFLDLDCRTGTAGDQDPIVLLHGIGCTWNIWNRQIPALAETRRVLAVNLRGSGASDPGPDGVTISDMASDVHSLLKQLSIETATVMGLSMGGMVALQHALDYPGEVSKLIVVGSMAGLPDGLESVADQQRDYINSHTSQEIAESRMTTAFGSEGDAELRQWAVDMIAGTNIDSYRAQASAAFGFNVISRLSEIGVPSEIIHGQNDMSLPIGLGLAIHEGIPGSVFHQVDGAGHFPNLENAASYNELIL